ncbi:hypothetical protein ABFS82_03G106900 [Erythranthe guttata]
MEVELLKNLPPEIVIEILSRLPIRTIKICKRVRNSWRDLIRTREFADSHLSKSVQGMVFCSEFNNYGVFAFEDGLDLQDPERRYEQITSFDCSYLCISICEIQGSVNGLLFLNPLSSISDAYYIFNPLTREYIEFPYEQRLLDIDFNGTVNYGFGVSKVSGQYKVVKTVHVKKSICHVYTLGTGKWRRIPAGPKLGENTNSSGAFLNGCLHWFVEDSKNPNLISCFDLETETFSTFPCPPSLSLYKRYQVVVALGGYLWICDNTDELVIAFWVMKEYGNEKSWTKEFVIRKRHPHCYGQPRGIVYPIKLFDDGHVLMTWEDEFNTFSEMYYYSNKTKTTAELDDCKVFGVSSGGSPMQAVPYTPSFVSLRSFPNEYVKSYKWF